MVDSCFTVAVFCVISALLAVLLKQYCSEQSMLISLAACCGAIIAAFAFLAPMTAEIRDIFLESGITDSYISLIFKAAAICYITQITAELCRDSGESAIASAAELWGRCAVTFMSIPVLKALLELINEII